MKRIARPFCCLLMAVLMSTTLIMPSFAAIREQADQSSVTYLEEFDGFYVKNVSPQDIIEAFDNDPQFTLCNEEVYSLDVEEMQTTDAVAEAAFASVGSNYNDTMATTFDRTYQLTGSATGIFGETLKITYTAILVLKTVKLQGRNYETFVKIKLGPTPAYPSGFYTPGSGTSEVLGEIVNSGATFQVSQIVALEVAIPLSLSGGIVAEIVESSSTVGLTYYARLIPETVTQRVILPIYNVIF